MIGARTRLDRTFTGAERVDAKNNITEFGQANTARLDVGVDASPGPVPMNRQDARRTPGSGFGAVQVGRHADTGSALKCQALDGVSVPDQSAQDFGFESAGGRRHAAE